MIDFVCLMTLALQLLSSPVLCSYLVSTSNNNQKRWELRGMMIPRDLRIYNDRIKTTSNKLCAAATSSIVYDEPVFRPPAEWRSLILQVTIGCSWNKCTFCEMYQTKNFRAKSLDEIQQELDHLLLAPTYGDPSDAVRDVFLADGDAMSLPTKHLLAILNMIQVRFPSVRRISSYCLPRNIYYKSIDDLKALKEAGLSLVYVGCESGSDKVLDAIQKGETYESSLRELTKLQQAGIRRSIMILLGLGGTRYSQEHAIQSAALASASQPEFLSVLTTSFPRGMDRVQQGYRRLHLMEQKSANSATLSSDEPSEVTKTDEKETPFFEALSARQSLQELQLFLKHTNITMNRTVFRSDHASNYLVLKGRLGRDKDYLLQQLGAVLDAPESEDVYNLRPEWARGL